MGHDLAGRREARPERGEAVMVLQRVSRRHQEPEAVEREAAQGQERHMPVTLMGRIEAAAKKADALAGAVRGEAGDHLGLLRSRSGPGLPRSTNAVIERGELLDTD